MNLEFGKSERRKEDRPMKNGWSADSATKNPEAARQPENEFKNEATEDRQKGSPDRGFKNAFYTQGEPKQQPRGKLTFP